MINQLEVNIMKGKFISWFLKWTGELGESILGTAKIKQKESKEKKCFIFHRWSRWHDTGKDNGMIHKFQSRVCKRCGLSQERKVFMDEFSL